MQKNTALLATNELVSSILTKNLSEENMKNLKTAPKELVESFTGAEVSEDINIDVVENSDTVINLVLPFYSQVDEEIAETLGDGDLEEIVGGEIFISIIIGASIGGIVGATIFTSTTASLGTAIAVGAVVAVAAGGASLAAVAGTAVAAANVGLESTTGQGVVHHTQEAVREWDSNVRK